ncbi:zona pellucida sperm-binding protein 3-like [Anomaloglossus baeobatrachus]|uniref:zona pellucida sperm-binding protein 3-like n=1 Tax=Anomaloglossus baeobatrachus TaxID=238106 RepID=UPI003F50BD6A
MELLVRWSWLVVVLLCEPGFSNSSARHRRQSDARSRNYPPGWGSSRGLGQFGSSRGVGLPVPGVGSPRGNPWSQSVSGLGALRGAQSAPRWDGRYNGRDNLRDLSHAPSSVSVQCGEDRMLVTVNRDFYGNGKLVKPSDLTLGSCRPGQQTTDTVVVFDNGLQECGNDLEMTPDWLIYSSTLRYAPTSSSNVPIIRSNSAVVPVQCFYPRHGNVSSNAIKPTWIPFSTTVTSEERLAFSLQLMTADFSAPSSILVFRLGEILYIEASLDIQNHVPMILFVDRCVATISPDMDSRPSYELISNNGCLMDSMEEDSSSVFVSPRPQANKLQFMVDAFRFTDSAASTIYITCTLRAAEINQTPDPMNKACSYNKASRSWSPVEGSSGICQCCSTRNCATAGGQRTQWGSNFGRQRGFGKRDIGSFLEKHSMATLGPILVTGSRTNQVTGAGTLQASRMGEGPEPLQLWLLVAIGSVTSVVVAVAFTVAGTCLLKRFSHKESV